MVYPRPVDSWNRRALLILIAIALASGVVYLVILSFKAPGT